MPDQARTSAIFRPGLLAGKVAIVTGAGSGLGRETALELARNGARVAICGRREEPLAETAELDPTGLISTHVCDIREEDQVDAFVEAVLAGHGQIDVLVNNAGGQFMVPAEDITPKGFRTVIRLNVEGTWLMTHAVATKAMIPESRGGMIVNITLTPHNGLPGIAHSSAARAAVENLTKVLGIEWSRFDIKLVAIAAGQFATETLLTKYPQVVVDNLEYSIPAGRLGRPEEIAWMVAYLASEAGDFHTGSVISIDGGRDNWLGPWPPTQIISDEGRPVAEERRKD